MITQIKLDLYAIMIIVIEWKPVSTPTKIKSKKGNNSAKMQTTTNIEPGLYYSMREKQL